MVSRKVSRKEAEKYARSLGFDNVWSDDRITFVAEHSPTRVAVRRDVRFSGEVTYEISWASTGTSRRDDKKVKTMIKMLQNALKLKAYVKKL